jgi:hypothetical protein
VHPVPGATVAVAPIPTAVIASTVVVPASGTVEVIPVQAPVDVQTVVIPVSSATVELVTDFPTIATVPGSKRTREESEEIEEQPLAKRRQHDVGGEHWPSFILSRNPRKGDKEHILYAPTREQRDHIQGYLQGDWRYATTMFQRNIPSPEPKLGFPHISWFLFVKVEDSKITDRVAVKCTDLSCDEDVGLAQGVAREAEVASALLLVECPHLPLYILPSAQEGAFTVQPVSMSKAGPSRWRLHYTYIAFEAHETLAHLIENHQKAHQ